ncbi:transcriptional regulator QRICH1-like [Haliotis rufescens]|uniref:transcriptional regulator QRICH1-like n=1 Tax=Haliotis rufescens TaxID=6454 RepID=UPI001EB04443|nr:transcriptional regulator QRICH1-like [Haliotis rufescens]
MQQSAGDLNVGLKFFLFEARKTNGELYPATIVYGLFTALASALKASGSSFKLMDDDIFQDSRKALDAVMRERCRGADCRKPTEVITREEEDALWKKGALGDSSPQQLLDTVLYLTGLHFALRGGKEHRALRLHLNPQITGPYTDQNGRRYLEYVEDVSKTNPGGIRERKVEKKRAWEYENTEHPERCYLKVFEKYKSLCPQSPTRPNAFYFAAQKKPREEKWFLESPVGHNTLQTL